MQIGMIDLNEVMPYVIIWIAWLIALFGVRNAFVNGKVRNYKRINQPIIFWLWTTFYISTLILVPVGTFVGIKHRLNQTEVVNPKTTIESDGNDQSTIP